MSLTYASYQTALATLAVQNDTTGGRWVNEIPLAIEYAELRIQRDLDLLATVFRDFSVTLTPGVRTFTVPAAFVVVEGVNAVTPPAAASADAGVRHPLTTYTRSYMDSTWPGGVTGVPTDMAPISQTTWLVGPAPDLAYKIEIIGTQRIPPLSASNTTTFISTNLPDLFLTASMIHIAAFQKNYGAQSGDPQQAISWESQYQTLLKGAIVEEARKRYASQAWGSASPTPVANPPRS